MSEFIKEHLSLSYRRTIREDNYDHSLAKVLRLVAEAKRDFPYLKDEDISVVVYGGDRIKGIMGIEFNTDGNGLAYDDYRTVSRLEYTLH